jgi:hypothetical protein
MRRHIRMYAEEKKMKRSSRRECEAIKENGGGGGRVS